MFDQTHVAVAWPATLVVVPNNVVGWVRVGTEIPLDKVARFICGKAEEDVEPVHVARVETDRKLCFSPGVTELGTEGITGHLRRSSHLASPSQ